MVYPGAGGDVVPKEGGFPSPSSSSQNLSRGTLLTSYVNPVGTFTSVVSIVNP